MLAEKRDENDERLTIYYCSIYDDGQLVRYLERPDVSWPINVASLDLP